jgi:hypothetical protein
VRVGVLLASLEDRSRKRDLDIVQTVVIVSRLPYRRPTDRSPAGVLSEGCGTCSTKHMLLAELVRENWPDRDMKLWHRVYKVSPRLAEALWGTQVSSVVPADGLVDVHTFATIDGARANVIVDATFPLGGWDGVSHIPVACGPGDDYPAGQEVLATKAKLVEQWCDPAVREPFIERLVQSTAP